MDNSRHQIQLGLSDTWRACAVLCALSAGLALIGLLGEDVAYAGFSGPGGPRLNYEYMPRIEDYKPRSEEVQKEAPSPRVPFVKRTPQLGPKKSEPPRAPQPGLQTDNRKVQQRVRPRSAPGRQVAPNQDARSKAPSRSTRRAPNATPPNAKPDVLLPDAGAQRKQILTRLYGYLSSAKEKGQAARLATSIERLWLHSGSPTTDILMKRANRAIETGRWGVAETFADAVVKLQPDYTEGWMRRALILYQRRQPTRALRDLRRVLALEPNHFVALDRVAAILESVGENRPALKAYRKLKRLHPQAPGLTKRIEELTRKVEGEQI